MKTMIVVTKKELSIALLGVLLLVLAPVLAVFLAGDKAAKASAANWGLSFPQKGEAPTIDVAPAVLEQYNAYYMGDPTQKTLYLTFDAGFENGYTPAILDTLKKHKVSATFFLVKNYLDTQPELVKRMVAEGHTVGNHTASHPDMSKLADKAAFQEELQILEEGYRQLIGKEMPRLYRPPQGKFSEENLKMASELGYATVFWSLAYVDWYVDDQPTCEEALNKLLPRTHNGAIVLLHSTSATNAAVLDDLLTKWKAEGYTFSTLPTLCKIA